MPFDDPEDISEATSAEDSNGNTDSHRTPMAITITGPVSTSTTTSVSTVTGSSTSSETSTTGNETASTTVSGGTEGPAGPGVCGFEPSDRDCGVCVDVECCDEVATCIDTEGCGCVLACFDAYSDPGRVFECLAECGLAEVPAGLPEVVSCMGERCDDCF